MTIEEAIWARVANLPAVLTLVGLRVYLDMYPQSVTYPAVRVQLVSEGFSYHLRGPSDCNASRIQIDVSARSVNGNDPYVEANVVMDAIDGDGGGKSASGLDGWIGAVGSPPVDVAAVFRLSRVRRWDPEELQIVTVSTDYMVWHR